MSTKPALDIPCKRPGVPVVEGPKGAVTYCTVPGCGWEYGVGVKSDVEQHAKWHRAAHRAAVPETSVHQLPAGPNYENRGYTAECACGWVAPKGTVTRSDNDASLAYHLSADHGLVSCS